MPKRKAATTPKPKTGKRKCKETITSDESTLTPANEEVPATQPTSDGIETSATQHRPSIRAKMVSDPTEAAPAPTGEPPASKEQDPLDSTVETTRSEPEIQHPEETPVSKEPEERESNNAEQPAENTIQDSPITCDAAPSQYKVNGPRDIDPTDDTTFPSYVCKWLELTLGIDIDDIEEKITLMWPLIVQWVALYCHTQTGVVEDMLSAEERQSIFNYLDTWCLYKDWDTMMENLPGQEPWSAKWFLPRLLAEAVISKTLFETVIRNPFFYVYSEDDDESFRASGRLPKFGKNLYQLYEKLKRASPGHAARWSAVTVRFLHAFTDKESNDGSIGVETAKWRDPIVQRLAADMLKPSSPLYPLLHKIDDPKKLEKRFRSLLPICRKMGTLSVLFGLNSEAYDFRDQVKDYQPYDEEDFTVEACTSSYTQVVENIDGRVPVLILRPELIARGFDWATGDVVDWRGHVEWEARGWETRCRSKVVLHKERDSSTDAR